MIERKRRNDFVRKREFDMLRKVRREGLSRRAARRPRRLVAPRRFAAAHLRQPARQDAGVKAKIDEIEQQMVGDGYVEHAAPRAPSSTTRRPSRRRSTWPRPPGAAPAPAPRAAARPHGGRVEDFVAAAPAPRRQDRHAVPAPRRARRRSRRSSLEMPPAEDFGKAFAAEQHRSHARPRPRRGGDRLRQRRLRAVRAVAASADRPRRQPRPARRDLAGAVRPLPRDRPAAQVREPGARLRPAVRLVGAAVVLDAQAGRRGGERRAAEQRAHRGPGRLGLPRATSMPTASPSCASLALQMPLPWVFDWGALQTIDAEACGRLSELFRSWIPQDLDMRWLVGRAAVHRARRKPRRPACATPTRRTGSSASTRCA